MDMLVLLEAMGLHFKEHHEAIMRWSWKLFCAKWIRLLEVADKEQRRQEQERTEAEFERLRQAHDEYAG